MNTTVKQRTKVYHTEYGKGTVVYIQFRKDDGLAMCFFPNHKVHDWALVSEIQNGTGDITLTPSTPSSKRKPDDSLQSALENLLGGGRR